MVFSNSDLCMVRFFKHFLTSCFDFDPLRLSLRLNVYTGNGVSLREIENEWLRSLELPRTSLRRHTVNHMPTSSSGLKKDRLPYGVCTLRLNDTGIVQHIFGAIQEYAGFQQSRWLDGPPRKPRKPQLAAR